MKRFFQYKYILVFCYTILLGLLVYVFTSSAFLREKDKVLGDNYGADSNTVSISAYVKTAYVKFRVYPEKRIPRIGNWGTYVDLVLKNCTNNKTYTFKNIQTDSQGYGQIPIDSSIVLWDGPYRWYVRGISHLNMKFNCYSAENLGNFVDLTKEGQELLAGEVSVIYDNYINALDMSVLVKNIYKNNYISDLNQDGKVNSLDFSNQIFNLYTLGD